MLPMGSAAEISSTGRPSSALLPVAHEDLFIWHHRIPLGGKHNVKDARLDQIHKLVEAKKKTYVQGHYRRRGGRHRRRRSPASDSGRLDVILRDLEFVENRLASEPEEPEKSVLHKIKAAFGG